MGAPRFACRRGGAQRRRLRSISSLYEELGQDRRQAVQRALLFYSFVFGQSLLFLEKSSRARRELTGACAELLAELAD
ncbi:MAG: hypothetical protein ACM31O_17830 [Bacteroidota bacterium]